MIRYRPTPRANYTRRTFEANSLWLISASIAQGRSSAKLCLAHELHEKGGRTILIISHQERIIRLADEIVLIANGEIAGRGTADELYPKLLSQTVAGCNLLEVNGIC